MTLLSPHFFHSPLVTLYAPSYCATSSPMMNTLSSLASSSSKAMFSASLTAKDFTMAGLEVERDLLPPEDAVHIREAARLLPATAIISCRSESSNKSLVVLDLGWRWR